MPQQLIPVHQGHTVNQYHAIQTYNAILPQFIEKKSQKK